jgi:hypothetical protein
VVIIIGALCVFGDIIKHAGKNKDLRPKPHLYLSIMRAFATRGDVDMVMRLNKRMWPDSVGAISRAAKEEAHELLMEAAINNNQVEMKPRMKLAVWKCDLNLLHICNTLVPWVLVLLNLTRISKTASPSESRCILGVLCACC